MLRVMKAVDQANGYIYGTDEKERTLSALVGSSIAAEFEYDKIGKIQEKYIANGTTDCDSELDSLQPMDLLH
jgi:hypothetical protein